MTIPKRGHIEVIEAIAKGLKDNVKNGTGLLERKELVRKM